MQWEGRMRIVWSWAVAAAALVLLGGGALAEPDRSVLLILADDFGVDAAAFYPTSADRRATKPPAPPTPNLANLAKRGVLFRRAWAMPWCSPTRVSLFTGRYPFRTGVGDPLPKEYSPSPGACRRASSACPRRSSGRARAIAWRTSASGT
jgi:arylsulfatase A-like enzyme